MNKSGAVNFVIHKIHAKNHPATVAIMLLNMGYGREDISKIFIQAGQSMDSLHQELVEGNDFLPPLKENLEQYFKKSNREIFEIEESIVSYKSSELPTYPAPARWVRGRGLGYAVPVTRHSFVFKLVNALSIVTLGIILAYIGIKLVDPKHVFDSQLQFSYWLAKINSPATILLAVIGISFLVYLFQLFTRRLHDAGMNKWLVFLLFTPILPFVAGLSKNDSFTLLIMSLIPAVTVFLTATLTPSHHNVRIRT